MAKILITLSAVLLTVVYVSYAAPSLNPNLFSLPVLMETIPVLSAACNTVFESSQKSCNKTIVAKMAHSRMTVEMKEAFGLGDSAKGEEILNKISCCSAYAMMDCLEADVKNKCSKNDADMMHIMIGMGRAQVVKNLCTKYPDSSKCEE